MTKGLPAAAALAVALVLAGVASAAGPAPTFIQSMSYGGTGCPQGTVGQSISDDRTRATLIYDAFVASAGPSTPITENRKNCQLNVNINQAAADTQWHQLTVTLRGYTQVPSGGAGHAALTAYTSGSTSQTTAGIDFPGPRAADYTWSRIVAVPPTPGSTQPINLNEQASVDVPAGSSGQQTVDSTDLALDAADPQALIAQLEGDVDAADLDHGLANDLGNKLAEASKSLAKGNKNAVKDACKKLDDFTKKVRDEAGKKNPKIDQSEADSWTTAAAQIEGVLGC